jgi:hypothetical protein
MWLSVAAFAANEPPAVTRNGVVLPAWLLKLDPVKKQLATALTTTFLLKANKEIRAILEVRYDLWDESYHVRRTENGRTAEERVRQLEPWFRTPIEWHDAELILEVLPFSAAEEKDAREWLFRSRRAWPGRSPSSRAISAMIGTTIAAKPIASYRWQVDLGAPK